MHKCCFLFCTQNFWVLLCFHLVTPSVLSVSHNETKSWEGKTPSCSVSMAAINLTQRSLDGCSDLGRNSFSDLWEKSRSLERGWGGLDLPVCRLSFSRELPSCFSAPKGDFTRWPVRSPQILPGWLCSLIYLCSTSCFTAYLIKMPAGNTKKLIFPLSPSFLI